MTEIQCVITGKVQRVGYRDFVQDAAAELGLFGYVQNQADGSVTLVAQGEPESLRLFVEYLHEGSPLSKVEGVAVEWRTSTKLYDDFSSLI
ncbi:MAG: acylphosphatase [Candidatus Paceibacterota bacterium]